MMMMDKGRVYLTLIGTENVIDEGKLNYCKKSTIASSDDEEVFNSLSPSVAECDCSRDFEHVSKC